MADIVLSTLNARYTHASLGLRSLLANLGALRERTRLLEFTLRTPTAEMVEALAAERPRIVGFGVYIWNVGRMTELVCALRARLPDVKIVLGGPEVSHETDSQPLVALADHVVTGAAEHAFARLAQALLHGPRPLMRIVPGDDPDPESLALPHPFYDERDIAHRHLYLEASRGCPFKCAFCLSALDRTARPFRPEALAAAIDDLLARGARRLRFVDRTFNLKIATCLAILGRFRRWLDEHPQERLFLHFELIPDRLPEPLRDAIATFPAGTLQFEIGLQTLDPAVQALIERRQDDRLAEENIRWLRTETGAHLHVDLIAGLPGESMTGFGEGFDRLVRMDPHEIQVGLLKRLRGSPLARRAGSLGLRFSETPPYTILETPVLSANEVERLTRFARHWDVIANSGRFPRTLPLLLGDAPFERFMMLGDALHARLQRLHGLPFEQWAGALHEACARLDPRAPDAVVADYRDSGAAGRPSFLSRGIAGRSRGAGNWRSDRAAARGTSLVHAPALPAPSAR